MFAVIREYNVNPGQRERIVREASQDLAPEIQKIPGFVSYTLAMPSDTQVISTSFWETREQAEESTRLAAELLKKFLLGIVQGPPRVTTGEVVIAERKSGASPRFGVMRRFKVTREQVQTMLPKVREGLVPILKNASGFGGYAVLDPDDGTIVSLATFDSREAGEAVAKLGTAWGQQNAADIPDPEITRAEIVFRVVNDAALVS